ncbi:MAG: glycerophosphodiester phosphodiesterase family protein, partial [Pseudomonadota bacterium]
ELDLQVSADGVAMVFHDATLDRMTAACGPVRSRPAAELAALGLWDTPEQIATLSAVLLRVDGRVPLLLELKDQSGHLSGSDQVLERAVLDCLERYRGLVAVMSFNPDQIAYFHEWAEYIPRGLATRRFTHGDWPGLPPVTAERLRAIADFDRVGAQFISHDARDLDNEHVAACKKHDVPILCWTVRSEAEEALARRVADNITFEGYRPALRPR